jgi:predicted transcriptional regulator
VNLEIIEMAKPPFVMSKYLTKESLYKEKAEYYQERCRNAEALLEQLMDRCKDEIADPEDISEIGAATSHIQAAFDDDRWMIG